MMAGREGRASFSGDLSLSLLQAFHALQIRLLCVRALSLTCLLWDPSLCLSSLCHLSECSKIPWDSYPYCTAE